MAQAQNESDLCRMVRLAERCGKIMNNSNNDRNNVGIRIMVIAVDMAIGDCSYDAVL